MLDRWFLEDVKETLTNNGRVVVIDPEGKALFLKGILKNIGWVLFLTLPMNWMRLK